MSNYALVRILVLRFVIPYASTKVNSYAMKLYPACGTLFGVNYAQCSLMRLFFSWLVASQSFASLHFAPSMITTCASIPPFFFNNYRLVSVEPKFLLLHMMCSIPGLSFYFILLSVLIKYLDLNVFLNKIESSNSCQGGQVSGIHIP